VFVLPEKGVLSAVVRTAVISTNEYLVVTTDCADRDNDVAASLMFQESGYPFLAVVLPSYHGMAVVGRLQGWHGMLNASTNEYFVGLQFTR